MSETVIPAEVFGEAVYVLDQLLADGDADRDDLVVRAMSAIGRVLPHLDDAASEAVLQAIAEVARTWPLSSIVDEGSGADALAKDKAGTRPDLDVRRGRASLASFPRPLRFELIDNFVSWSADLLNTCTHMPRPGTGAGLTYAASWKPGTIVCQQCTRLLGKPPSSCRVCSDEPAPVAGWVSFGPELIFMYRTCERCQPTIDTPEE